MESVPLQQNIMRPVQTVYFPSISDVNRILDIGEILRSVLTQEEINLINKFLIS